MKNNKGVTMIALTVTIIILVMLTGIVTVNITKQLNIRDINKLYSDIEAISARVSEYYLKNENLPIYSNKKYVNSKAELELLFIQNGAKEHITNVNDGDDYYVINLSLLENLTLNYGYDYKLWTTATTAQDIQEVYIINTITHQIYYPAGVQLDDGACFTHYSDDNQINKITLQSASHNWVISQISNCTKTALDENNISISANVTISGLTTENNEPRYDFNSFEYAWTDDINDDASTLTFTKFKSNTTINNGTANVILSSKAFAKTTQNVYLWIGLMDENGNFIYKKYQNSIPIPNVTVQ